MTTAPALHAEPFRPHPLVANQHAQTVLGTLLPRTFPEAEAWRQGGEERPRAPGREAWMDGYWAENQALRYVGWLAEAR